ncbi:MAG: hypothetical protein A2X12_08675 [Bacteroidetes bacterium GWE2_29_8]|nr:MAG: hypothetical protein A2X12_08675 [Bacteroidetes bacterium GWE2_29_8]
MDLWIKIFVLFSFILLGFLLKRFNIINDNIAKYFLKLVFYFTLPCLILNTFVNIQLDFDLLLYPIYALIYLIIIFFVGYLTKEYFNLNNDEKSVWISSMMIINIGFVIPFIFLFFGNLGFSKLMMFDIVHGIITYTFTFYITYKFSSKKTKSQAYKLILFNIPLISLLIALLANVNNLHIGYFNDYFYYVGWLTIPLVLLSLGYYINFRNILNKKVLFPVFIKASSALLICLLLWIIFHPQAEDLIIITIILTGPVGYNALTFAGILKTDEKYAASIISASLILSLFVCFLLFNFAI